jgi:predicted TIM-barrel fold metal-dependent hydrolase
MLCGAAGVLATGRFAARAAEPEPEKAPLPSGDPAIVDPHQHLWDLSKFSWPWLKGSPLDRSFVMKDYREATAGLRLVAAVYMETDVAEQYQRAEADYILEICRRGDTPTRAAVIGGPVGAEGFRKYITPFKGSPYVKGVRRLLFKPEMRAGRCLEKPFLDSIRLLGDLGMRFDICIAASELADAARLAALCPGTQFVLDHCGNADVKAFRAARTEEDARRAVQQWRKDIAAVAAQKNVVCKISGIISTAPKKGWTADDLAPIVNHCMDSFGSDRAMFASDWPVCTLVASYRQWVGALREIVRNRSAADQRKLFAENAVRVYGLKLEANPR